MQIKFHSTLYNLIGYNHSSTRFQATVEKGNNTFDSIISDTVNAKEIAIIDNDETIGVYSGYTHRIAIGIYPDNSISVELQNTDIQSQIDAILAQVQTQETAIADLGEMVSSENETNSLQDSAIEELADAVNTITPEEG